MGKKGSWFSAIKRVFTPHSKEKHLSSNNNQEPERKSNNKEKKKKSSGKKLKHGESNSFLPIFRQPSSIEKILCEAEREHNLVFRPPSPKASSPFAPSSPIRLSSPRITSQRYVSSPKPISPRKASSQVPSPKPLSPRPVSPRAPSPRRFSPRIVQRREFVHRPEPTLRVKHASATKIQAGFRGYMARRSFKALKGLVRLQGVIRGQSVKRQTMNAMKYMQLLVRVQTQVQSRRIQMLEKRARNEKNDTRFTSSLESDDWDDSVLTKEEKEARLHRKIDAMIKRERSMAYAYSHQLWKNSPKSAQDIRTSGFPLWWNWVDREKSQNTPLRDFKLTPMRPSPSPQPQSSNQNHFRLNNNSFDTSTPNSSKSVFFTPSRPIHTPQPHSSVSRYSRGGGGGGGRGAMEDSPFKDNDSLTSCPPFSAPSYMAPTVSAKAKLRAHSNPKDRVERSPVTTTNEKRRSSFPLGSFKWNKGSLFMSSNSNSNNKKGPGSSSSGVVELEKHKTLKSLGNLSIDSTVSMPATVGRKAFNRFA